MDYTSLGVFSSLALFVLALVFSAFGERCNDFMFRHFGYAFYMYSLAEVLYLLKPFAGFASELRLNEVIVGLLVGLASLVLLIGALNGGRHNKETPHVMFMAILVSVFVGVYGQSSIDIPISFAAGVGSLTAAVLLWRKDIQDARCMTMHKILGSLFLIRAFTFMSLPLGAGVRSNSIQADSFACIVLVVAMIVVMVPLSRCRTRLPSHCEEGAD